MSRETKPKHIQVQVDYYSHGLIHQAAAKCRESIKAFARRAILEQAARVMKKDREKRTP